MGGILMPENEFSEKKKLRITDTLMLLKLMIGQKLLGVSTSDDYKEWTLHFEDFVLFLPKGLPFPSPIIGRIKWSDINVHT
jgi:hypothetical protein